jgi:uncharacterized protein YdgA (DUF945 family)
MDAVDAAEAGDLVLTLLYIAIGLVALLASYSWYAYKEKQAAIKLRFRDGQSRFDKQEHAQSIIAEKQTQLDNTMTKVCAEYIHRDQCNEHRQTHDTIHGRLDSKLDRMIDSQTDQGKQIAEMGGTIRTVAKTTARMLAQRVSIPNNEVEQ